MDADTYNVHNGHNLGVAAMQRDAYDGAVRLTRREWIRCLQEWEKRGLSYSKLGMMAGANRSTSRSWFKDGRLPQPHHETAAIRAFLKMGIAVTPPEAAGVQVGPSPSASSDVESSRETSVSPEEAEMDSFAKDQMRTLISRMSVREADLLWPVLRQMYDACRHAIDAPAEQEEERRAS